MYSDEESFPIKIEYFNEITGGDSDLQKTLAEIFISSAQECMDSIGPDSDEETLKASLHALRGICEGIGAVGLSEICFNTEKGDVTAEEKLVLFDKMKIEYKVVIDFLESKYMN